MKVWGLLLLTSVLSGMAQLCQKQAAMNHHVHSPSYHFYLWMLVALGLLAIAMLCWLCVLSVLPVGIAYPLLSLNYLWVALLSRLLWHDRITPRQWLGILLIIVGTVLLGATY
ncbi:4-amino-4-deoxy-L-arabinose-phosphoundecaprenol flippase subunit ArnE [Rosenbergiella australiborealis]|uniref:4-amino-4-deoxy-L-arabinose-phosphoundecaprenol flippase subunit ArnE n=1 Tax=Rosenbergiella australiborealis TaxID=1544696 RepID=A0ABS5T0K9_9GAMM|nr:4-amino-4-deoxy-L-arabinose-phosphoundecaprenol flippase subunit ArnE [Rosenbergiella australiborealis]MBT0725871.1 4-amino-4-deoxy-L-arabinose-phosphoundecaprenol flippase subunit ArnE [Rosenbergiella australiborealis]